MRCARACGPPVNKWRPAMKRFRSELHVIECLRGCLRVIPGRFAGAAAGRKHRCRTSAGRNTMLFVTLHGGKPGKVPQKNNNVHAYDKEGKKVTAGLLEESERVLLDELRSIDCFGHYLYVINANQTQN